MTDDEREEQRRRSPTGAASKVAVATTNASP
jgi:hypothetical protein